MPARGPRLVRRRGCREHPGEALTEHEGLVLQHRVEQPQGGQRQLERAPPAGSFLPGTGRRGRARPARLRPRRAIRARGTANTRSRCRAPSDRRTRWGYYDAPSIWLAPMIRQGRSRVTAAQECAASGSATAGSYWPRAVPATDSGRPRIPCRSIMDTLTAYFIRGPHCGAPGELNVTPVPRQCVMQNNKVRRRSSSQRRERDLGRGA